jgi:hypothetical protein
VQKIAPYKAQQRAAETFWKDAEKGGRVGLVGDAAHCEFVSVSASSPFPSLVRLGFDLDWQVLSAIFVRFAFWHRLDIGQPPLRNLHQSKTH